MTTHPPSDEDFVALLPPLRRVTAALGLDAATAEDIVQETIARLLAERVRMDRATLTSYAIVTARNAAASLRREEQTRARHQHRLLEPTATPLPEEKMLRREEHAALAAALDVLPPQDRALLTAREITGQPLPDIAKEQGISPSALAVRMSRARARLRVEYVIALRHAHLPTSRCRPVLLALSAGDRRRQAQLGAGQHLLTCPSCVALADPLLHRNRRLAGLLPWPGIAAIGKFLRHAFGRRPVQMAAGATVAAGVAAGLILTSGGRPPAPAILTVAGQNLTSRTANHLQHHAGETAAAHGATVAAVAADEGFWVRGQGPARVWVQLIGRGESPQHVRAGDKVSFHGVVATNPRHFAAQADSSAGSALLNREGAHIDVRFQALRVTKTAR